VFSFVEFHLVNLLFIHLILNMLLQVPSPKSIYCIHTIMIINRDSNINNLINLHLFIDEAEEEKKRIVKPRKPVLNPQPKLDPIRYVIIRQFFKLK
jgi:hypothetical protein